jgi:hypothetical protein
VIRSTDTGTYGVAALRGEATRVRDGPGIIPHNTARAELIAAGGTLIGSAHWPPNAREVIRVVEAGLTAGAANPVARRKDAA